MRGISIFLYFRIANKKITRNFSKTKITAQLSFCLNCLPRAASTTSRARVCYHADFKNKGTSKVSIGRKIHGIIIVQCIYNCYRKLGLLKKRKNESSAGNARKRRKGEVTETTNISKNIDSQFQVFFMQVSCSRMW